MGISLDLNKVDNPSKVGSGGRVKPGRCHVVAVKFEEYGEPKSGAHIAHLEVLAHDDPSQVGKVFKDFLFDPANASSDKGAVHSAERLLHCAYTFGLTTPEAMDAAKKSGSQAEISFGDIAGRHAFCELTDEEYNGKTNTKVGDAGFALYGLDDPACADYPKNAAMAARASKSQPAANGTATMPTQAKQEDADPFAGGV